MVYTEVHDVKDKADADDADADDAAVQAKADHAADAGARTVSLSRRSQKIRPPSLPRPSLPRGLGSQVTASAAAKAKTAQSKGPIRLVDPAENHHAGHPLQQDGEETLLTKEQLVLALKSKLGAEAGVATVLTHTPRNLLLPRTL